MAEFNLRITDGSVSKEKYDEIAPVGAVVSGFSDRLIRRKWLEMVCDLWRPSLRYKGQRLNSKREATAANFMANCGWTQARCDAIAAIWSEDLWRRWMDTEREPVGQDLAKSQLWDGDIASQSGWIGAVGKEFHGIEDVVNCFPWSLDNRKKFFIVPADGLTQTEAESLGGKKLDVVDFREVILPRHVIDWAADLGLSEQEKSDVADPEIVVHPRYDRRVAREKIRAATASVREGIRVR
jgi:hypothetical protein